MIFWADPHDILIVMNEMLKNQPSSTSARQIRITHIADFQIFPF